MKKLIPLLMLIATMMMAQVSSQTARRFVKGATKPSTCAVGDVWEDTSTSPSIAYHCNVTNTWAAFSNGSVTVDNHLNSLIDPTGNTAFSMAAFTLNFNTSSNSGTANPFSVSDFATNTGTGYLFTISSGSSSTIKPFRACYRGTTNCVLMNTTLLTTSGTAAIDATKLSGNLPALDISAATGAPTLTGTNFTGIPWSGLAAGNQTFGIYYGDRSEIAAPANPGANTCREYVDSTTHKWTFIDSTGASCLSASGTPGGSNTQLQYNNSSTFGGASNTEYVSATGVVSVNQKADTNDTIYSKRFTDTTPTGNFLHFQNAAANADLFTVDVSGNMTSAGSGTFGGTGGVVPNTAGVGSVGSATFPFANIFFAGTSGTPGTNNFEFVGASTGGTRTITAVDANMVLPQSYSCTNQVATALSGTTGATTCSSLTAAFLPTVTVAKGGLNTTDPSFATLTLSASAVTWDLASALVANASVTLDGADTINITNAVAGGDYSIKVIQDASGSRTVTWGTGCTWKWRGGVKTLTTTANAIDYVTFKYDGTNCLASLGTDYK